MPSITFLLSGGDEAVIDAPVGGSVMDAAVRNNVPGIVAECGGSCSCCTCHVHIDKEWYGVFGEPSDEERELLEFADNYSEYSRLSCQLVVTSRCDGLRLRVPDSAG
ncbi:2Fe-2S iron-sulfur cluster-binding protein [Mycobacterium sp. SMC-19]|uniref:2Fe-2S iron-sulfur cluster-binding protein n=1 Tax=Mycobacterium sp. SMC-19 TaxID=3381630 RepID=UPI003877395F